MLKSLLITDVFPPRTGGSGRWFRELYGRLPEAEYLIAAGEAPGQDEYDRVNPLSLCRLPLGIRTRGIRGPGSLREYAQPLRLLISLVRTRRIGAVHCARCLPEGILGLGLRLLAGIPYACYAHGEELMSASLSREQTLWARVVLARARLVIANSRNTARILEAEWAVPASKIDVLHPGVDTSKFVPAGRDLKTRSELGWGDRPVVLTVGRLQKRKGHDRMILALEQVRRVRPDVLYAIVGDGEERQSLSDLAGGNDLQDHVQFLGEVGDDQLIRCYQQCDLFILPNREVNRDIEGFGMVLLEAQACGKPVIAGASGGTSEAMRDPETGRIVLCDDLDELAQCVIDLLSDASTLARMGEAARRWVVEHFDWETAAKLARGRFERVTGGRRRGRPVRMD